jgi:hypothetical protein
MFPESAFAPAGIAFRQRASPGSFYVIYLDVINLTYAIKLDLIVAKDNPDCHGSLWANTLWESVT